MFCFDFTNFLVPTWVLLIQKYIPSCLDVKYSFLGQFLAIFSYFQRGTCCIYKTVTLSANFGLRKPPQLFPNHGDDDKCDLELCLKRDIMWALFDGLPGQDEEIDLIGS